jgi:predicted O-methyltransferase YrrM
MSLIKEFQETFPKFKTGWEGHANLTDKTCDVIKRTYELTKPKKMLEIGFNAGHSAFGWLTLCPDLQYHSVDICQHSYTMDHMIKMKEVFGDRFTYGKGDSKVMNLNFVKQFDLVFIDGGHEPEDIEHDYNLCRSAGVKMILVDDYTLRSGIRALIDHVISSENHPYELVEKLEYDDQRDITTQVLLKRIADEKV